MDNFISFFFPSHLFLWSRCNETYFQARPDRFEYPFVVCVFITPIKPNLRLVIAEIPLLDRLALHHFQNTRDNTRRNQALSLQQY